MLVFTMKVGEAITINDDIHLVAEETAPYRHQFRCWLCNYEGVLYTNPVMVSDPKTFGSGFSSSWRP